MYNYLSSYMNISYKVNRSISFRDLSIKIVLMHIQYYETYRLLY